MPRELIVPEPGRATLHEYEEAELDDGAVRLQSTLTGFKHGTELRAYRGDTRDHRAPFDWELRLHREEAPADAYPFYPGNVTIGTVRELGRDVSTFAIGDRVYGHLPARESHTVPASELSPVPEGMPMAAVVYVDPARVALQLARVGGVRPGDTVAVFGAGAIGQMAARLARSAGADRTVVSEPLARRRTAANGAADVVIDPGATDAGERVKTAVSSGTEPGVDVSLETSGTYAGLHDAIRSTAYGGVVASCGYYANDPSALALAGEWHRNRLDLRSVRPPSEPLREHPRWSYERLDRVAFDMLASGAIDVNGLLEPIVPFDEAPDGLRLIDERPGESIKLAITYD